MTRMDNVFERLVSKAEKPEDFTTTELVDVYNIAAKFLEQPTLNSFHDKTKAVARVTGILVTYRSVAAEDRKTPGMDRLAASGAAEGVRETVLADQRRAAAAVAEGGPTVPEPPTEVNGYPLPAGAAGRPGRYSGAEVITLLAATNPKRGESAKRFAMYATGQTVGEYLAAVKDRRLGLRDLAWDLARGYIRVE